MRWLPGWIAGYVALTAIVLWSMFAARDGVIARLSMPQSVAQWQAWRDAVRQQQANPGPVERRVPKSGEPPALVLMRDYFGVSLLGAFVFSTALYWVVAWFVSGMLLGGPSDDVN
jgi:hypothetical protein